MHLLLTAGGVFLWVVPNVIRWDSPGAALLVGLVGWAAIFAIYFGVRKFIFRDSTQAIWMPLRFLIGGHSCFCGCHVILCGVLNPTRSQAVYGTH